LAVLSIALIIVIGYIAMRMCTRRSVKPTHLPSSSKLEPQFVIDSNDTKEIFSGKRRKQNAGDATSDG